MPNTNNSTASTEKLGLHLLVVEDSAEDLLLLKSLLAPMHQVSSVATANEAIEFCSQQVPEFVIVDYMLPEMDGVTLAAELRRNPDMLHVPIIMWTIFGTAETLSGALRSGVDDHLSKNDTTADQLQEAIERNYEAKLIDKASQADRHTVNQANHVLTRRHDVFAEFWERQSHQLLTDLSSVQEFVSLLMDELPGSINEDQGKCLAMARGGCAELQRTIEKIQGMTNLDKNIDKLVWQSEDIVLLVAGVIESKRLDAKAAGIALAVTHDQLPLVLSEKYGLSKLLDSVISTGLSISGPGGEVSLDITQKLPQQVSVALRIKCEGRSAAKVLEHPGQQLKDHLNSANATNYSCRLIPGVGIELGFDLSIYERSHTKDAA